MKNLFFFVLAILVTVSSARQLFQARHRILGNVHEYRFEEHIGSNDTKLLIAIKDAGYNKTCHVIEIGDEIHTNLGNIEYRRNLTQEVYTLITQHRGNTEEVSATELYNMYKDKIIRWECLRHNTYIMTYPPNFANSTVAPE